MTDPIDLGDHRPAVFYTVRLKQDWKGGLSVYVEDVADDERSRAAVADALERAAQMLRDPDYVTERMT